MKLLISISALLQISFASRYYAGTTPLAACQFEPRQCTKDGPLCETCTSLVTCVETSNNTFVKTPTETCSTGQNCVGGKCVDQTVETSVFCDGTACLAFQCQDVGIFPHQYFCNKFVLCVKSNNALVAYENTCPAGWGFDVKNSRCNVNLGAAGCDDEILPLPPCEFAGQVGSVNGSDHLYFVCQPYSKNVATLYPVIYPCGPGTVSNGNGCA